MAMLPTKPGVALLLNCGLPYFSYMYYIYLFSYILQFNYYESDLDDYMESVSTGFILLFWIGQG